MKTETSKLIEQLAAKLGTTTEYLWGILMEDLVNKNFVNTSVSRRLPTSEDVKRWHQILTGMGEAEMLKDMEATFG